MFAAPIPPSSGRPQPASLPRVSVSGALPPPPPPPARPGVRNSSDSHSRRRARAGGGGGRGQGHVSPRKVCRRGRGMAGASHVHICHPREAGCPSTSGPPAAASGAGLRVLLPSRGGPRPSPGCAHRWRPSPTSSQVRLPPLPNTVRPPFCWGGG